MNQNKQGKRYVWCCHRTRIYLHILTWSVASFDIQHLDLDIETTTRERWNEEAIQMNLDDLVAAVERADEASRLGDIEYTECVVASH